MPVSVEGMKNIEAPNPHQITVRRACLPEVMLAEDVAAVLDLTPSGARRAIRRGECGPYLRIGRRLAMLRESFLRSLTRRQRPTSSLLPLQPPPDARGPKRC